MEPPSPVNLRVGVQRKSVVESDSRSSESSILNPRFVN